jgi:hypothetical protein
MGGKEPHMGNIHSMHTRLDMFDSDEDALVAVYQNGECGSEMNWLRLMWN